LGLPSKLRYISLKTSSGANIDFLDAMLDEEIQTTVTEQFILKTYSLIGMRDNRPLPLQTIF
jgi:hypothetical protein